MTKAIGAFALSILLMLLPAAQGFAAKLGPAKNFGELLSLTASARSGDTILVAGELAAQNEQPFSSEGELYITGTDSGAAIRGLTLKDASLVFSNLSLLDGMTVSGDSHVQLLRGVTLHGCLDFSGSGALLLDPGTSVFAGSGAPGVRVRHTGGDLYISLDGVITGSEGEAAAVIDPLGASGALMVTGKLTGGDGSIGGNALNLHNMSGNAYITVDGELTGGDGNLGGSGLQLITADGSVNALLGGRITGGKGHSYGGDAMLIMNVGGSASVVLSGMLTGGSSSGTDSTPGQSLKLLGKTTAMRTNVGSCILQDGRQVLYSIAVTPLPAITSEAPDVLPEKTPSPTDAPAAEPTAKPTAEPTEAPTAEPTAEPTLEPTEAPTAEPTAEPTLEPTEAPTAEPTAEPTLEPTEAPVPQPTDAPAATAGEAI